MKNKLILAFTLFLTACHPHKPVSAFYQGDYTLPFKEWGFVFFTPKYLRAMVTDAAVVDTEGTMYRFHTLDSAQDDWYTVGTWNKKYRGAYYFNKIEHPAPPMYMVVCWDSWVDKKHYETSMFFLKPVWKRMMTPSDHKTDTGKTFWFDTFLIGLAPGGTVKVWLEGNGRWALNLPVPTTNM